MELVDDGEVSAYLFDGLMVGDQLELRGPIGGYFVWEASQGSPLLLVGGGSGVIPLMAMLRHRAAAHSAVPAQMLYSVRTPQDVIYAAKLKRLAQAQSGPKLLLTFTRQAPPGWKGYARCIDQVCWQKFFVSTVRRYTLTYVDRLCWSNQSLIFC